MKLKADLVKEIQGMEKEDKEMLISYLKGKNMKSEVVNNNKVEITKKVNDEIHHYIENKKNTENKTTKENANMGENKVTTNNDELSLEKLKKLKKEDEKSTNENQDDSGDDKEENKGKKMTARMKRNLYKTQDNLIDDVREVKKNNVVILKDVKKYNEEDYGMDITGAELAELYLNEDLVFDPTMQRGVKEDKEGFTRAVFYDNHVRKIADSIVDGTFAPDAIHFAIIKEDTSMEYDEQDRELKVDGFARLLDGQHRTRAFIKVKNDLQTDKFDTGVDLNKYIFNVRIHHVSAQRAREIFDQLDKGRKLDKSQKRQLQSDVYSKITKHLNSDENSPLRNLVALARPVGDRLVLFSTIAEALEKNEFYKCDTEKQGDENLKELKRFFECVVDKFSHAFSLDVKRRKEYRDEYLLNQNNFFPVWLQISTLTRGKKKEEINELLDKMVQNEQFFKKENPLWLERTVVKRSTSKNNKGFAISNSKTTLKFLRDETMNMLLDKMSDESKKLSKDFLGKSKDNDKK